MQMRSVWSIYTTHARNAAWHYKGCVQLNIHYWLLLLGGAWAEHICSHDQCDHGNNNASLGTTWGGKFNLYDISRKLAYLLWRGLIRAHCLLL